MRRVRVFDRGLRRASDPASVNAFSLVINRDARDELPRCVHMRLLRGGCADGHANNQLRAGCSARRVEGREGRVREVCEARCIDGIEHSLVAGVGLWRSFVRVRMQAEANQVHGARSREFKPRVSLYPRFEQARKSHVFADVRAQAFEAVMSNHKPQFQAAKPPAQRHVPIAIIKDRAGFARGVAQILRRDAHARGEACAIARPEAVTVEISQQPLVRIETETIGMLNTCQPRLILRTNARGSGVSSVDMQPRTMRG